MVHHGLSGTFGLAGLGGGGGGGLGGGGGGGLGGGELIHFVGWRHWPLPPLRRLTFFQSKKKVSKKFSPHQGPYASLRVPSLRCRYGALRATTCFAKSTLRNFGHGRRRFALAPTRHLRSALLVNGAGKSKARSKAKEQKQKSKSKRAKAKEPCLLIHRGPKARAQRIVLLILIHPPR